ncbi:MAG TPA: hypothetical protein VNQ74_07175 [Burkholderiaceae bacterium]|nr:hypothetical protein [Burkholderiaceae bacterium]
MTAKVSSTSALRADVLRRAISSLSRLRGEVVRVSTVALRQSEGSVVGLVANNKAVAHKPQRPKATLK